MEDFIAGYIAAMLWADTPDTDMENCDSSHISDELMERIRSDCAKFYPMIATLSLGDDSQNGHDFYLTTQGHGVGFWDRDYGSDGDVATEYCTQFDAFDIYLGDDGKIYG